MRLSIIVPVYNVEDYLIRCVQSILAQELTDYEIILVDDASTDQSGVLCDELQLQYNEIRVIHQQANGGLSAARNAGIEAAIGAYLTFVDSDDELTDNTLKENIEYLIKHPETDMLEYPVEVHAGSSKAYLVSFPGEAQTNDIFADWIRREGYAHSYACNKIFAAHIWKNLRYPIGRYFEDGYVMPTIVRQCRTVYYSNHGCYRYMINPNSITTRHRYIKQRQLFENNYRLYTEIKGNDLLQDEAIQLWIRCLNQLIDMGRCADVDKEDYNHIVEQTENTHPPYATLLKAATLDRRYKTKAIKLLPLPLVGLKAYCRSYIALTPPLK